MAGRLDDVVTAPDEPEVAVLVPANQVPAEVPPTDEAGPIALGAAEVATKHRRPTGPQGQFALLAHRRLDGATLGAQRHLSLVVTGQHGGLDARQRSAHRAGADIHARVVRHHDPPGLGLPPVVVNGEPQRVLAPRDDLGVERLAHAGDEAKAAQVVLLGHRRSGLHQHAQRGRRRVPDSDRLALEHLVPPLCVEVALVDDRRHPVHERRDDAVRGSGDPTGVSRAPKDVVGVQVQGDPARGVVRNDGVVHVDRALGRAGRPAREMQQRHVLGIGGPDFVVSVRLGEQLVEVPCSLEPRRARRLGSSHQQHVAQLGELVTNPRHLAAVQDRGGHEHPTATDVEALANRLGTERREERAHDTAMLESSQRDDVEVLRARHQGEDPFTGLHAERGEHVREPVRALVQFGVGDVDAPPVSVQTTQCHVIATSARGVTDHGLVGDVEPSTTRQPVERSSGRVPREAGPLTFVVHHVRNRAPILSGLRNHVLVHRSTPSAISEA